MKLHVNVNRTSGTPLSSFKSPLSKNELEKYGFEGFIIDMIEGPEPVLSLLCEAYKFHLVVSTIVKTRKKF
jgi:hypothetical protein